MKKEVEVMEPETPAPRTRSQISRRKALVSMGAAVPASMLLPRALSVAAQDAGTPTAGADNPSIGDAVPIMNVEGVQVATVKVNSVTDPFQGYRPSNPPARGSRFVVISVTVEASGDLPFGFDPYRIFLQDDQGFVIYPSNVDLGEAPVEPAVVGGEVAPGTPNSGAIGYTVIRGVTPIRVFFAPAGDRLIMLADLRA
jgi:hypothetical protein